MNARRKAKLTALSRAEMIHRIVVLRQPVAQVAGGFGLSERCACQWLARFRAEGAAGLADRSSRPRCPPKNHPPAARRPRPGSAPPLAAGLPDRSRRQALHGFGLGLPAPSRRTTARAFCTSADLPLRARTPGRAAPFRASRNSPASCARATASPATASAIPPAARAGNASTSPWMITRGFPSPNSSPMKPPAVSSPCSTPLWPSSKGSACASGASPRTTAPPTAPAPWPPKSPASQVAGLPSRRPRPPAPLHTLLHSENQRQGRALPPNLPPRMGPRSRLLPFRPTLRSPPVLPS